MFLRLKGWLLVMHGLSATDIAPLQTDSEEFEMENNFTYLESVMSFDGEILEIFAVRWLKLHGFLAVYDIQSLLMMLCWWELGELFIRQLYVHVLAVLLYGAET